MDEAEKVVLPQILQLAEDGEWEMPSGGTHPDHEEWIERGWGARDYEGNWYFRHNAEGPVRRWLARQGYEDTGDGSHYRRRPVLTPAERDEMARQHQHEENARLLRLPGSRG